MRFSKAIIPAALLILVFVIFSFTSARNVTRYLASFFFPESVTPEYLRDKHERSRTSVLIIPGHFYNPLGGTQYRGLLESEMTKQAASELEKFFRSDPRFVVFNEQDLLYYFENSKDIRTFRNETRKITKNLLNQGSLEKKLGVEHSTISEEDSVKLYGINKWVNDHNIDIVIHTHFNDYPRRSQRQPGQYSGYAIYIPEKQLPNHRVSSEIANSISIELNKYFPISNYRLESAGVVEDQDLIAVGANASIYGAAVLLEYGYIYEPHIASSAVRPSSLKELAYQTYKGIKKYFEPEAKDFLSETYSSKIDKSLEIGIKNSPEVFSLQVVLSKLGIYPPSGLTKNDCPPSGNFGECTRRAVMNFQKKYGIEPTGTVGPKTLEKLNEVAFEIKNL